MTTDDILAEGLTKEEILKRLLQPPSDEETIRIGPRPLRTFTKPYKDYRSYKLPLSKDFHGKCGYCDIPDIYDGVSAYHIDHFAPKEKFPDKINEYSNLVYSCRVCNIKKDDDWPSESADKPIVGEEGYIDPCSIDYENNFCRNSDGKIMYKSPVARYMHDHLNFYMKRHSIAWKMTKTKIIRDNLEDILNNPDSYRLLKEDIEELRDYFHKYNAYFIDYLQAYWRVRENDP